MPTIMIDKFDGLRPRVDPELLANEEAQVAHNVDLDHGKLDILTAPPTRPTEDPFVVCDEDAIIAKPNAPTPDSSAAYAFDGAADKNNAQLTWYGWSTYGTTANPWMVGPSVNPADNKVKYIGTVYGNSSVQMSFNFPGSPPPSTTALNNWILWLQSHFDDGHYSLSFKTKTGAGAGSGSPVTIPAAGEEQTIGLPPASFIGQTPVALYLNDGVTEFKYADLTLTDFAAQDLFETLRADPEEDDPTQLEHYDRTRAQEHGVSIWADMNYQNTSIDFCSYCMTVYDDSSGTLWESPPSDTTDPIMRRPGQYVRVKLSQTDKTRRLYRYNPANGKYCLLAVVAAGLEYYYDMKPDRSLTDALEPEDKSYGNPPDVISYTTGGAPPVVTAGKCADPTRAVYMPGNYWIAHEYDDAADPKVSYLWFSTPGKAWEWPEKYKVTFKEKILGLGVVGNDCVVMTNDEPYVVSASHPRYAFPQKIIVNQPCVSKYTIFRTNNVVGYMGLGGIVVVRGSSAHVISLSHYTIQQWKALLLASFTVADTGDDKADYATLATAVGDDDDYTPDTAVLSMWARHTKLIVEIPSWLAMFEFNGTDQLSRHVTFDREPTRKLTWMSKHFSWNRPVTFAAARAICDDYDSASVLTLFRRTSRLAAYASTAWVTTPLSGPRDAAFQLADNDVPDKNWDLQIESKFHVDQIAASSRLRSLREG